jgi:hypothetical protein
VRAEEVRGAAVALGTERPPGCLVALAVRHRRRKAARRRLGRNGQSVDRGGIRPLLSGAPCSCRGNVGKCYWICPQLALTLWGSFYSAVSVQFRYKSLKYLYKNQSLEPDTLAGWAEYRTEVGNYLFRLFDPPSQLHAMAEFDAALQLNPANTRAATLRQRLIQQETPGGVSRDLDMAPDYKDISTGLLGEVQLVLSEFLAVQGTATQEEIAASTKDQLSLVLKQLSDRMAEAQLDIVSANDAIQVADAERNMYSTQVTNLQEQIFALQHQKLSLSDMVTTLGAVAGAIAGVATCRPRPPLFFLGARRASRLDPVS